MTRHRLVCALLGSMLLVVAGSRYSVAHGPGHNPSRFQHVMQHGIPAAYRGLLNPLRATADNLAAGKSLYAENCAACHGAAGAGDGEAAADLKPAPPSLTDMFARPMAGMGQPARGAHLMHGRMHHHPGMTHAQAMGGLNLDAYSYWAISEGGAPMDSAMPAFKNSLSETERWQILLYVANGFRSAANQ